MPSFAAPLVLLQADYEEISYPVKWIVSIVDIDFMNTSAIRDDLIRPRRDLNFTRRKSVKMRFKGLDLNLLVALDALLKTRSISRAAEEIHLSQSAMSNALARLREHFDDPLLAQVGRKMELTPRAETLIETVRDILNRIDTTITEQPEFIPADSTRTFRLLVSEYTTAVLMPTLLSMVWQESKSIGFELLPQVTTPTQMLNDGDADMLIMPNAFMDSDHPSDTLYEDNYSCVVWRDNRVIGETLSIDQYLAASHVVAAVGPTRVSLEGWFLERYGVTRNIQVTTPNLMAPCMLVVGTDRIATVHTRIVREAAKTLPIRALTPPIEFPRLVQAMQWHKYRTKDPGITWLRERLREASRAIDIGK